MDLHFSERDVHERCHGSVRALARRGGEGRGMGLQHFTHGKWPLFFSIKPENAPPLCLFQLVLRARGSRRLQGTSSRLLLRVATTQLRLAHQVLIDQPDWPSSITRRPKHSNEAVSGGWARHLWFLVVHFEPSTRFSSLSSRVGGGLDLLRQDRKIAEVCFFFSALVTAMNIVIVSLDHWSVDYFVACSVSYWHNTRKSSGKIAAPSNQSRETPLVFS